MPQFDLPDDALSESPELMHKGKLAQAENSLASLERALLHRPRTGGALNELGILCHQRGRLDDALQCFEEAVRLTPENASAHNNLGNARKLKGRLADAISAYRAAVQYQPASADFELNLGRALQELGDNVEAASRYRNAAELEPKRAETHGALATLCLAAGRNDEAYRAARRALKFAGTDLALRVNMANLLQEIGRHAESETEYLRVLEIEPQYFAAHSNLAYLLADQGRNAQSRTHYEAAIRSDPSPRLKIVAATKIPPISSSIEQIRQCREELALNLQSLYDAGARIDPRREMMPTLFYLAYHGQNDRSLSEQLARLAVADDSRPSPVVRGGRIRVGFLSMNLKQHTIGGLWTGLIEGLSRDEFDVRILAASPGEDSITRRIRARSDGYHHLPRNVPEALRIAREQNLDILLFPDIGMDPFTYTLASTRIAPIQCVTWGHPTTTGLGSVDYFLSSEHLETATSDAFYTEKLARFQRLMVCYDRPSLGSATRGRGHFGIPENAHVYGCPQSLFKFHPDFDEVIRAILDADPQGILVLIEGRYAHWKDLLLQRFQRNLGRLSERIRFISRLSRPEYLNLLSVSDVLLDPLHFGGGNTSYEGFAMGAPIVTLPSEFLRARLTYAMYKQMGLDDFIARDASHYVSLAVELGTNSDFRNSARRKIASTAACLYEDQSGIREFEDFLRAAVNAESESTGRRIDWRPSEK